MMVVKNKEAVLSIIGAVVINRAILIICVSILLGSCGLHEYEAGEAAKQQILSYESFVNIQVKDKSNLYNDQKDFNQMLVASK